MKRFAVAAGVVVGAIVLLAVLGMFPIMQRVLIAGVGSLSILAGCFSKGPFRAGKRGDGEIIAPWFGRTFFVGIGLLTLYAAVFVKFG